MSINNLRTPNAVYVSVKRGKSVCAGTKVATEKSVGDFLAQGSRHVE
jgi:hypothetical protein